MVLPKIKGVKNILNFAKKIFTKGSFRAVNNYVSGLIALGKKTVKKISQAAKINQSALNYTLTEAKFEQEELEKRYYKKINFMFKNYEIYLLIDDTLVERDGKKIEQAQKHFDHNEEKYINGHQFFTAILWTPFLQLPIFPKLYSKETDSKIEMAKELIDKLDNNGIKLHTVLFDSWYSDKDLINKCKSINARVICTIKSNRNIFIGKSNKPRKISHINSRLISQKMHKYTVDNKDYLVWERHVRLPKIHRLKFIISHEMKDEKIRGKAQLISTNPSDTSEEIIRTYKIRWCIETYHRDIKQNLGFASAFFRRENGIVRHAIFVAIAYATLNLFMYRKGIQMTIGECCEYLRDKSSTSLVKEIVEIENKPERLERFGEVFIS
jgi:SRSO17 transposase